MRGEERRAAIAAYKERKIACGIYLVRCRASGEVWVGGWTNVDAIQSRIWFTLRQGTNPNHELLGSWRRHGENQFQFEILERVDDEASSYIRSAFLKERAAHWRLALNAKPI
jgi:hypothetical protein